MEPNRARYRVEVVKPAFLEPDGGALPEAQIAVYENCGWEYVASWRMLHFFRALVVVMFSGGAPVPGAGGGGGAAGGRAAGRYAPVAGWLVEGGMEADAYVMSAKVRAEVKDAFGLYDPDNPSDVTPTLGASNGKTLHDLRGKAINDPAWDALLDQLAFASKQAIREIYLKPFEICVMNYDIAATSLWLSCPSLESLCICLALSTVAHGSIGRAHTRTRPHYRCCTSWGKSRGARAICGCIGQTGKAA